MRRERLSAPLLATDDGRDLRRDADADLLPTLVDAVLRAPVDWRRGIASAAGVGVVIDFGCGRTAGVGNLYYRAAVVASSSEQERRQQPIEIVVASMLSFVGLSPPPPAEFRTRTEFSC